MAPKRKPKFSFATIRQLKLRDYWIIFKRMSKYYYLRILREPDSVHRLAMGVACGIFVGFLPIIPFQTVAVLALAFVLRGNKLAAWIATFISNPVNLIPFYAMLYAVGRIFINTRAKLILKEEALTLRALLHRGTELYGVMVVGGLALGIPAAIFSYFLTKYLVKRYRKLRMAKVMKAWQRRQEDAQAESARPQGSASKNRPPYAA